MTHTTETPAPTTTDSVDISGPPRLTFGQGLRRVLGRNEAPVLLIIIVIFIITAFLSPAFLTPGNLTTFLIGMSAQAIVAIGMTFALASGGIDLSVGAVLGLSAMVAAFTFTAGVDIWIAALLGLAAGALVGAINGILIGVMKINALIATLGTMTIGFGVTLVLSGGISVSVSSAPDAFLNLGAGRVYGIPTIAIIFVVIAIIADILMRRSVALRRVIYVGSNEKAARLSGISALRVQLGVYITVALLAAFAGLLSLARFGVASPDFGAGSELLAIAAAVIGGAAIGGGTGSVWGSVLGVVLINLINNALVLLGVSVNWQDIVFGVILLIAVAADQLSRRRRAARLPAGG